MLGRVCGRNHDQQKPQATQTKHRKAAAGNIGGDITDNLVLGAFLGHEAFLSLKSASCSYMEYWPSQRCTSFCGFMQIVMVRDAP